MLIRHSIRCSTLGLLLILPGMTADAASPTRHHAVQTVSTGRAVYRTVQAQPTYDIRQPELVSGARATLFANFLRDEPGMVLLRIDGTTAECEILEWKPQSATVQLPRLGLSRPKYAELRIVLPDGRIAKSFAVTLVAQPDIVVHAESVPQPMPPAPQAQPAVYATPIEGGFVFYSTTQ